MSDERVDPEPAIGKPASPAFGEKTGEKVQLHIGEWKDGRWSYLYGDDTDYKGAEFDLDDVRQAAKDAREGELPKIIQGPILNPPVWTWEVPLYFWFGGVATGSSFVAMAADAAADHESAALARKVTLAAILPGAPLLVLDLGRPLRFLHMMRIFKVRSPMSMGAWCLSAFSGAVATAVLADVAGRPRIARLLGVPTAALGTYLGSYTGVLLASTAVPVWNRSRAFLPPIFMCTAAAGGAAANRLVLVARGMPVGHPTREALGAVETAAMTAELILSAANERRLGPLGDALEHGRPGRLFTFAKWAVRGGLALRVGRRAGGPWVHHLASVLYLLAGLAFRFAWVGAGRTSAQDHEAVAAAARA
jgi:hypothetical protein